MDLTDATAVLARTPETLDTLLAGLAPGWLNHNDGPGSWSASEIVGHLAHADATDWMPRVHTILRAGPTEVFERFDRTAMLHGEREELATTLERFRTLRTANLGELTGLGLEPSDLDRRGLHPELGEVTLGQLLSTWVAHDLTHIAQIGEVMARRYRDEVGPWRAYLPALERRADAE
jgi:hypothetical protein